LRNIIESLGKRGLEQSGKYPVNENDEEFGADSSVCGTTEQRNNTSSWPGLTRPSTPSLAQAIKTWMPGTSPGMTKVLSTVIASQRVARTRAR
jgi:hypothetical protein